MINWKEKLAAYLHDPPSKALDIKDHQERSASAYRQAGFTDEEISAFSKKADHMASAADRLPFPSSQSSGLRCCFDGRRNQFHHPLSGTPFSFHAEFRTQEVAFDGESSVQPVLKNFGSIPEQNHWRARFFAHWRLWPEAATKNDYRFSLLPADTRIPDHSIWNHMQVVSALASCSENDTPAFLKFQIGPVQEFIAQARSTRDLWSGSYLLSWLMAAGMKILSAHVGPDAVIFPNLRGQPIFDLHWKKELWDQVSIGDKPVWHSFGYSDSNNSTKLLTPNLPNVFLAIVPASKAKELGAIVDAAIRTELKAIADSVWNYCDSAALPDKKVLTGDEGENGITRQQRLERFNKQVDNFRSTAWQATPWPKTLPEALDLATRFSPEMPAQIARQRVQAVVNMATKIPVEHRDKRYYTSDAKNELNNIGLGWSVLLAVNGWQLDAVRQTRPFNAWSAGGWEEGITNNKDALNGRDEAVAGGSSWGERCETLGTPWENLFKKTDWVGAMTLIKRVWHLAYLQDKWNLPTSGNSFPMPNTRDIAAHKPFSFSDKDEEFADSLSGSDKYFAVLALDGDEIGKWVSGEKTPLFQTQLASYKDGSNVQEFGALPYYSKHYPALLTSQRPLSPSYHLQFSEALSNFALKCARPIVEAFDGRLIYAGGDDVLALLPADSAADCATALRLAFKGNSDLNNFMSNRKAQNCLMATIQPGFLSLTDEQDQNRKPIPFLVPGPSAEVSVGIAIAHFKSPLQDVVRAAQAAEKRAKTKLKRAAIAITLMKRSGEIIEWGCKWQSGGLELYDAIANALSTDELSSKFPYRVVELLNPYCANEVPLKPAPVQNAPGFPIDQIIIKELNHALNRQRGSKYSDQTAEKINRLLQNYLKQLNTSDTTAKINAVVGLCQTVAFANRTSREE